MGIVLRIKSALLNKHAGSHLHHQVHKILTADTWHLNRSACLQVIALGIEPGNHRLV